MKVVERAGGRTGGGERGGNLRKRADWIPSRQYLVNAGAVDIDDLERPFAGGDLVRFGGHAAEYFHEPS